MRVAVAGTEVAEGTAFTVDTTTGIVTFLAGHIPASGAAVTAGFLFDVPVRFDTDYLEVDLSAFAAGAIPKIPLVEIRPVRPAHIPIRACRPSSTRGVTTLCRCWLITRSDGVTQGFTDHDEDVVLGDVTCRAGSGLTGSEATQKLGLAVDGSELSGALADDTLNEDDLAAGRYDAAAVELWLVDWSEPDLRVLLAKGTLGEVQARGHGLHRRGARPEPAARRGHRAALHRDLLGRSRRCALHGRSDRRGLSRQRHGDRADGDLGLHRQRARRVSPTAGSPPASSPSPAAPMPGLASR